MGRVRTYITVGEKKLWALFDTGARNTYIISDKTTGLQIWDMSVNEPVALGGKVHVVQKGCILIGKIEGYPVHLKARIIDDIGQDEEGKKIEILLGALAMQEWGIRPVPDEEKLDMTHYPKEFIEF